MKTLKIVFSILFCLVLIFMVSSVAFAATEAPVPETEVPIETEQVVTEEIQTEEQIPDKTEEYTETVDPYEHAYETSNLPEVESYEIETATTMPIPKIEISDTSLIAGVIAWVCVALGIAVIVGVLVSKRTTNKKK